MDQDLGEIYLLQRVLTCYHGYPNPVFFDIGANIGEYTDKILGLRKNLASIHLFEPTNKCFEILAKKYQEYNWIYLNKWAVSDKNEEVSIFYDQEGSKLASLYHRDLTNYSIEMNQSEKIKTIRLDEYIKNGHIQHIHLLKIDTEGHELAVLKGLGTYLNSGFIDFIQFEYGGTYIDSNIRLYDVYGMLERSGFKIGKMTAQGLKILPFQSWMEDYKYANYVAKAKSIHPRFLI